MNMNTKRHEHPLRPFRTCRWRRARACFDALRDSRLVQDIAAAIALTLFCVNVAVWLAILSSWRGM